MHVLHIFNFLRRNLKLLKSLFCKFLVCRPYAREKVIPLSLRHITVINLLSFTLHKFYDFRRQYFGVLLVLLRRTRRQTYGYKCTFQPRFYALKLL